jgi:uncharacterized spore protein YtfJ
MAKPARAASQVPALRRLAARLSGARLCFGKPVEAAGRVVIPVASLRTAGGGGFGRGQQAQSGGDVGGGGGGMLEARPIGFIEIGPNGSRFEAISEPTPPLRAIASGALALLVMRRVASARRAGRVRLPRPVRPRLPSPRR